jgi:hypothetical protein
MRNFFLAIGILLPVSPGHTGGARSLRLFQVNLNAVSAAFHHVYPAQGIYLGRSGGQKKLLYGGRLIPEVILGQQVKLRFHVGFPLSSSSSWLETK